MIKTRIVVGVDGSTGSTAAVRWAATEARLRKVELRVLTAYHRQQLGRGVAVGRQRPPAEQEAGAAVHAAVAEARSVAPGLEVRGVAQSGYAVPVLLHAAEEAALLVVGCGGGGMPGMPGGSVDNQVATHARGCVVVVRGRSTADAGPVVVGVDVESPAAQTVIGRAFEEAALRGAALLAVTTRGDGRTPDAGQDSPLDRWRDKFPEVTADHEVVRGNPEKVLVERSRRAQLVVVGPRRHGFEGVLLGAVGTRLLQRAECPVLIARP